MDDLHLSCTTSTTSESTCDKITTTSLFRDWTGLPPELVDVIATKLDKFSDYLYFCGVCSQWRSVALRSESAHKQSMILVKASRKKIPMLMIKTREHSNEMRGLYSVSYGVMYDFKLPCSCRHRFFGSSHGWLLTYDESKVITLFNPLTDICISLPAFKEHFYAKWDDYDHPDFFVLKGVLSADPLVSPNNYMVAIIYGGMGKLAVYKSGDLHWELIDMQPEYYHVFSDILFYKGNLYGVTYISKLMLIDVVNNSWTTIVPSDELWDYNVTYLVDLRGELLLVQRFWVSDDEDVDDEDSDVSIEYDPDYRFYLNTRTDEFKIFKLMHENESAKWVQIKNIGELTIFLGDNHSLSVSLAEFPECRPNSIYYTSQFYLETAPYGCNGLEDDSVIFSLEDGKSYSHHLLDYFEWYIEPPIWFLPNPDL